MKNSKTYPEQSKRQQTRAARYVNNYSRLWKGDYEDPLARERLVTHGLAPGCRRANTDTQEAESLSGAGFTAAA